jgi:hypothetical protein
MSRFRVEHPSREGIHAVAGVDHALGFFVEVFREDRDKPIRSLDMFTAKRAVTLQDCFDFMIEHGFFTADQLRNALVFLQDGAPRPKDTRVVEVVVKFKAWSR